MRSSDWSSDVCSSDLQTVVQVPFVARIRDDVPFRGERQTGTAIIGEHSFIVDADKSQNLGIHIGDSAPQGEAAHRRSEEHTSELQSLMRISYAVFSLKPQNTNTENITQHQHRHYK